MRFFLHFTVITIFSISGLAKADGSRPTNKITLSPGASALVQAGVDTEVACSAGGSSTSDLRFCSVKHGSDSICGFDNVCAVLHYQEGDVLKEEKLTHCGDEDLPASYEACDKKLIDNPTCRPSGDRFCTVKNGSNSVCGFDNVCVVLSYRLGNTRKEMTLKNCGDEDRPESFTQCEQALKKHPACS